MDLQDLNVTSDQVQVSTARVWITRMAIALLILAILTGIGYGIKKLLGGGPAHKKQITTVKLLPDTPPPPPPPPPKEPPKETPKEQPKEAPKEPEPKPAETPPAETLKMEGAAGDGPSPFQSGAVNNEYKGGAVATIGSDGGVKFRWYAGLVKSQIERAIERDKKLTQGQYKIVVSVWLKPNGQFERLSVDQSDTTPEIEQGIREALNDLPAMQDSPPENMPMPIRLRISAKKMG
ncbi:MULTISPECIES: TonB C-terminal domain-containing protein [unclassified Methylophilus]|uniref:TonB C-terminal domain-containing protein n=1 Tax=unclassified Methylophilus TaxID=2630143 RepID=UPI0006FB3C91|nr:MULTISPECIES: TonB C-terminal domain-containing protein [unclassified Methylophilus]KQT41820.1 TonB-dependent receptor [Methylophilus sp. Leaf416]KQT55986.1 TonB-dependent receptor [Methylophilus sp. Leaf459]